MRKRTIVQGEHAVLADPQVAIVTVLGSCVAVCLHDSAARVGGMNHFLLGEPAGNRPLGANELQRYGIHAMELLINEMMRQGAARHRLRAHLYGGANVVRALRSIGDSNAAFARRFIAEEGIALARADLGGHHARRVEFLPYEGKARCIAVEATPEQVPARPKLPPSGELELF